MRYYLVSVAWYGNGGAYGYGCKVQPGTNLRQLRRSLGFRANSPENEDPSIFLLCMERLHCFGNEKLEKAFARLQERTDWQLVLGRAYCLGFEYKFLPLFQLQSLIKYLQKFFCETPSSAAELLEGDKDAMRLVELLYMQGRRNCVEPNSPR
jgi:hypothetical protein